LVIDESVSLRLLGPARGEADKTVAD
jgi:hypothetical protein